VHFVLDGDGVLFGVESDQISKTHGLECFERRERENAGIPMAHGPFGHSFLQKLVWLRRICRNDDGSNRVRVSIVTARSAPAHERVIRTLRNWGTLLDEAHFVGHNSKASFVGAAGGHIFFDDREKHVVEASAVVSAGLVPVLQSR
jgi:5'-nucleotidase